MTAHVAEATRTLAPAAPRRRLRRVLLVIAMIVVLALIAGGAFALWTVRRPLPQTGGEARLAGLDGAVRVVRDAHGIPQIYASTAEDLFRAQGYVHAQDRFFEMDYRRHVTAGRLAELVGENADAIKADKVVRTLGWRRVAQVEWDTVLSPTTKAYLQAYADGVNAYLKDRKPSQIALEYTVLGTTVRVDAPQKWDPVDSVAWLKAMAWDLRGNYHTELGRALAYTTIKDVARVNELFPAYPSSQNAPILSPRDLTNTADDGAAAPLSKDGVDLASPAVSRALSATAGALGAVPVLIGKDDGVGSNSWVVAGRYTTTGRPLLANDPHLDFSAPSVWVQGGLHCTDVGPACPFDVAGFSFAGFPGIIIGHNAKLAWGVTNMYADVTDFFIERVREDTYLRGADWEPMTTRRETIHVNGGDDVHLEVVSTMHGPIISDVLDDVEPVVESPTEGPKLGEFAVALGWTALTPGYTADAVFMLNTAADADDVRAAAEKFEVPAQNIVFATTDGHIGYQAPGAIPIRQNVPGAPVPSDGTWPRPGWDERYDWTGYVSSDRMPRALDPAEGFIVAANQAVLPASSEPFLSRDWDYGYRAQRIRTLIEERIAAGKKFSVATMNTIQNDDVSPYAAILVPALLDQRLPDAFSAAGQRLLADWDYHMEEDSAAAAYFAAVWRNLLRITFWDDLPAAYRPQGNSQWLAVIQNLLGKEHDAFWDNRETVSVVESRDEVLTQALVLARRDLTVRLGKKPSDWRWGALHRLAPKHPVLGGDTIPGVVSNYFNPDAVGVPGSGSLVNAMSWDASTNSFEVTAGPALRMVVDLADLDNSTWLIPLGVSGHPASTHYTDQYSAFTAGRTFAWPYSASAVAAAQDKELRLRP